MLDQARYCDNCETTYEYLGNGVKCERCGSSNTYQANCLSCKHSFSTEENELVCCFDKDNHKFVDDFYNCGNFKY